MSSRSGTEPPPHRLEALPFAETIVLHNPAVGKIELHRGEETIHSGEEHLPYYRHRGQVLLSQTETPHADDTRAIGMSNAAFVAAVPLLSRSQFHRSIHTQVRNVLRAPNSRHAWATRRAVIATALAADVEQPEPHMQPTTRNPDWMFFDVARVLVKGGTGGDGCLAFRREKGIPKGGPAGGSGGSGGSVIFVATAGANTLAKFRGGAAFRASDGLNGTGKGRTGHCARDLTVPVPLGTVVRNAGGRILSDLSEEGQTFCVARGGRGGRGNEAFKTDRNRAPRVCEQGEPGVERWLQMELKLVADVALVGFPNAGKSTILDSVSNAKPKIADYPFTTIVPNLGVVDGVYDANGLVIADVPGLIEGAHRGVGMGVAFLRHVERCKVVVHIVDGSAEDLIEKYKAIRLEMELFDKRLASKKEVVLVNKVDLPGVREKWESYLRDDLVDTIRDHKRIALVSAKSREGLAETMRRLAALVASVGDDDNVVVLGDEDGLGLEPAVVEKEGDGHFRVSGYKVEQAYRMTNWDYIEGVDRFQRILAALGVNQMLVDVGAQDGDSIACYDKEFSYYKEENVYSVAASLDGYVD